ncbi:MAG: DUF2442 domain-containing protein [Elainella sp.]
MSPKVMRFQPLAFKLRLFFEKGEVRCFDVTPYLDQGIFTELKQTHYFQQVTPFFGGVQWPHEQDFSADTLYLQSIVDQEWSAA